MMPELRQEILTRTSRTYLPFYPVVKWISIFCSLSKAKLSLGISFTASLGCVLFTGEITTSVFLCTLGVFFLSGGCCGLNQVQEAKADAVMNRTANRPIPSGRITVQAGILLSAIAIVTGLCLLRQIALQKFIVLLLATMAPLWYNGVYTCAKKHTRFAILIGAPLGALGPMIGWCAAGGTLADPLILLVGLFCLLWQVPHFFLILLTRSKEYERAGFKTWNQSLTPAQFQRIIFSWILATLTAGVFLSLWHPIPLPWRLLLWIYSAFLGFKSLSLLQPTPPTLSARDPLLYGVGVLVLLCLG